MPRMVTVKLGLRTSTRGRHDDDAITTDIWGGRPWGQPDELYKDPHPPHKELPLPTPL